MATTPKTAAGKQLLSNAEKRRRARANPAPTGTTRVTATRGRDGNYTLSGLGPEITNRVNSRRAEERHDVQAAQHRQKVAENHEEAGRSIPDSFNPAEDQRITNDAAPAPEGFASDYGFNPEGQFSTRPGSPGQFQVNGLEAIEKRRDDRIREAQATGGQGYGGVETAIERINQEAEKEAEAFVRQQEVQKIQQEQERERAKGQAAATAASLEAQQRSSTASTIDSATIQALTTSLGPEAQLLGQALQQGLQATNDAISDQGVLLGQSQSLADQVHSGQMSLLDAIQQRMQTEQRQVQTFLDDARERQINQLEKQRQLEEDRLQWQQDQLVRQERQKKSKEVDRMAAELALRGGFGSVSGNAEIAEVERDWEQSITDLRAEFGFARADLSVKFSAQYNDIQDNYQKNVLDVTKQYRAEQTKLDLQAFSSFSTMAETKQRALESYVNNVASLKLEKAKELKSGIKDMVTMRNQKKSLERAAEEKAWSELKWVQSTFGKAAPQSLIDSIQAKLPNVNVAEFLATPTLSQRKAASSGSGSSYRFDLAQVDSLGQPPTFESYFEQRLAEHEESIAQSMTAAERRKFKDAVQKEYDAKKSSSNRYDASKLMLRLVDRTRNSAKHIRQNAEQQVAEMINKGQYEQASRFIDGIGSPISATERNDYIQALNARSNVQRISEMLEDFGTQGPISGRLRDANLWEVKNAELNGLITQTVPGLARGIFKEVGVLTDTDIERYKKTIPNGKATVQQAQVLTKNLLDTINLSMEHQISIHDAAGLNIRDIRERIDSDDRTSFGDTVQPSPEDLDYIRSLGL